MVARSAPPGILVLVPLAGQDSLSVSQAVIVMAGDLPAPLKRSLIWDCGAEMARHSEITARQVPVYLAQPHSPWRRGSNGNLNRFVCEYLPPGHRDHQRSRLDQGRHR